MNIFFASDNKFVQHLCVSIASILYNAASTDEFIFYILDSNISEKNKQKIMKLKSIKNFEIEFIKVSDEMFKDCPITKDCSHITKQTYYRYIIPIIKPELDKCLYLDCDIVVEDSLSSLWQKDIEDYYVAAVEELHYETSIDAKRLNLDTMFNAGILLINLKKWKEQNITNQLFKNTAELSKLNKLRWQDQDVLNYTFKNQVLFVEPKYNLQCNAYYDGWLNKYTQEELESAKIAPVIIHYNSCYKPWSNQCKHPLWKRYYNYLKITPFKLDYYKWKIGYYKIKYNMLKTIFSISNGNMHKIIKFFGITFKFKSEKLKQRKINEELKTEIDILKQDLINIKNKLSDKEGINV